MFFYLVLFVSLSFLSASAATLSAYSLPSAFAFAMAASSAFILSTMENILRALPAIVYIIIIGPIIMMSMSVFSFQKQSATSSARIRTRNSVFLMYRMLSMSEFFICKYHLLSYRAQRGYAYNNAKKIKRIETMLTMISKYEGSSCFVNNCTSR